MTAPIGSVVGGSITDGLKVRLDPGSNAQVGQYVVAHVDSQARLLGMVKDISLRSAESGPTSWPPAGGEDPAAALLREVLLDTAVFTELDVQPYLEVDVATGSSARARRLPRHFASVELADQDTMNRAFDTAERPALSLGRPLGMEEIEAYVDIERLFERSAGIFGKSGTGKTVYALQFLSALVKNSESAPSGPDRTVALVFDMHNDYGQRMKFEGGDRKSLKALHPSDVAVVTLEETGEADRRLVIGTRDIEPDDLRVLQSVSEFTSAGLDAADIFEERLGKDWIDLVLESEPPPRLARLVGDDGADWAAVCKALDIHPATFTSFRRRLRSLTRKDFVQQGEAQFHGAIQWVVQALQGGKSVVVQFGRHGLDIASYMLVANMLARRVWQAYARDMEQARGERAKQPNRLVIVIEEAHRFVDKAFSGQSIFGQIARELRKYNVTLLVIDQRPSQIDSEVLSQVGTKFCLQLDSDADIDALVGAMGARSGLRQVIASLESQRQALVFGHGVPMPVVVTPPELTATFRPGGTLRQRLGVAPPEPSEPRRGLFG